MLIGMDRETLTLTMELDLTPLGITVGVFPVDKEMGLVPLGIVGLPLDMGLDL